jgi:hypothetical protein
MRPKAKPIPVNPPRRYWNVYGGNPPTFGSSGWETLLEANASARTKERIACLEITTTVRNVL